MITPQIIAQGIATILAGFAGIIIMRDIGRSEHLGKPATGLIRQLMLFSFPGADEKRNPYAGATFIGLFLLAIALFGIASSLYKLYRQ